MPRSRRAWSAGPDASCSSCRMANRRKQRSCSSVSTSGSRKGKHEMTHPSITSSSFSEAMERCGYFGAIHRLLSEYSDLPLPAPLDVERFGRVLDVACGDGTWLLEMARLNPELNFVGVDADSWAILAAGQSARARRLDHARFLLADLYKLSHLEDLAE